MWVSKKRSILVPKNNFCFPSAQVYIWEDAQKHINPHAQYCIIIVLPHYITQPANTDSACHSGQQPQSKECIYIHTYRYIYTYICIYRYLHIDIHTHIYIYIDIHYIYTNVYIYTYIYIAFYRANYLPISKACGILWAMQTRDASQWFSTGILRCQMMTPSQFVCTMGPVVQHMIPVIRRKVNIV